MKEEKGELTTVGIVVLITAIILGSLYFYDKGQTKTINSSIELGKSVNLSLSKVRTKPSKYGKSYLIFDAIASNTTNKAVDFHATYPKSPCVTVSSIGGEYNKCVSSPEYTTYLDEYDAVSLQNESNRSGLELQAPNNEYCTLADYYVSNRSINNIGYGLTNYYQANESKAGVIVFQCPTQKGSYSLIYKDQTEQINI